MSAPLLYCVPQTRIPEENPELHFRTEQLREYLVSAMAKDMSVLVAVRRVRSAAACVRLRSRATQQWRAALLVPLITSAAALKESDAAGFHFPSTATPTPTLTTNASIANAAANEEARATNAGGDPREGLGDYVGDEAAEYALAQVQLLDTAPKSLRNLPHQARLAVQLQRALPAATRAPL